MKIRYASKIGLELVIPITLIFVTILALILGEEKSWFGILIFLPVIIFVVHMFITTSYTIQGELLHIKCGFLFDKKVDIKSIKKIKETNNPLSAPATSLDRLEISYAKFDCVLISPKQKMGFINEIKKINPNVEVKLKKMQI